MGKIKLNLTSGAIIEKPLINAFTANNNSYVILDNEINGSMGLPIILVCKLIDNKLIKIVDQNEWQIVKEYLKNIIAGGKVEFLKINDVLNADDIYYTQLTLPVPSFDALKKAYQINDNDGSNAVTSATTTATIQNPEVTIETASIPDVNIPPMSNQATMMMPENPTIQNSNVNLNNPNSLQPEVKIDNPVNIIPPEMPIQPQSPIGINELNTSSVGEVTPVTQNTGSFNNNTSVVESVPNSTIDMSTPMPTFSAGNNFNSSLDGEVVAPNQENLIKGQEINNRFQEQKEAFMQACENMFDALVQKFEKEITNQKKD